MRTRIAAALPVAGLAAVLLAGCESGGGGASSSSVAPPTPSPSGTATPAAPSAAPGTGNAIAGSAASSTASRAPATSSAAATSSTASASFAGFVGTWEGHSRRLVISRSGTMTLTFRTYRNCTAGVTTGCDRTVGNTIIDGGNVTGHISSVYNATTVQVSVDSTTDPRDFPDRPFTLGHDLGHHALAARVGTFAEAPFCGSDAPGGYCGA